MRTSLLIIVAIILLVPSAHASDCDSYYYPPLCKLFDGSKADYPSGYVRHASQVMNYFFLNAESASEFDFKGNFTLAANVWKSVCNISMQEDGFGECFVNWIDDPNNPFYGSGADTYTEISSGNITQVIITFYEYFMPWGVPYTWCNECACPAPSQQQSILYVCLHEIGHAIGLQHFIGATVMDDRVGSCYRYLTNLDECCAAFLYQSNALARVSYFKPVSQGPGVRIEWKSRYEYGTDRYFIEKGTGDGSYERLSDPIVSVGATRSRDALEYEYLDPAGRYGDAYRLIEVDKDGCEHQIGEARAVMPPIEAPASQDAPTIGSLEREIGTILEREEKVTDASLRAPMSGEKEWVAIYPSSFAAAISPLVSYRYYHGLEASGISYESIVAQYGNIKTYLQHLWDSEGHRLKYVLIVGSYDMIPIDVVNEGIVEDFPVNYHTDAIAVDVDNDWFPEISIGRIPARSTDQVTAYVAKVLDYESQARQARNNDVTFFVNDGNFNEESGALAGHLATELAGLVPPAQTVHYKNYKDCTDANQEPCGDLDRRTQAIGEFDTGRGTVLGFGSASSEYELVFWLRTFGGEYEFRGSQLCENHKCPFVIGSSCDMGYMTDGAPPTILDELLFASYRGAIAFFAPSGATWQYANYEIAADIIAYLYNWGSPSIGYACWRAQAHEMGDQLLGNAHTARSYVLYGDPAIKLKGSVSGAAPVVTVTDPNGGESYSTPGPIPITWHVGDDDLEGIRCTVLMNYDGGSGNWSVLATNVPVDANGQASYSYRLETGLITYEHCLVQVLATDACNNQGSDISDGEFTIHLLMPPSKPGDAIPVDPVSGMPIVPKDDFLGAPYPNPFNPITTIGFGLNAPAWIALTIYNVNGAVVKSLCRSEHMNAGTHARRWDGTNNAGTRVASGIYFLQMKTERFSCTRRLVLLR